MTDPSGYPGAPPGWHPDPAGGPGQRWWDGYAWTDATVLPQQPPPPPPPPSWTPAPPPMSPPAMPPPALQGSQTPPWAMGPERLDGHTAAQRVEDEQGRVKLARVAVAIPGVYFLVGLLLQRVNADQLRSAGRQLRIDWTDTQRGITPPQYHATTSAYSPIGLLIGILTVAAVVIACIWQHKAATAGRALGIPSRSSPGWGVGCWFVPIVNLWMPYAAIRDCLPVGHAQRPRILHWWIALLLAEFLSFAAGGAALFSTGTALIFSVPAVLASLAVLAWAPGIVVAIASAHEDALAGKTGISRA